MYRKVYEIKKYTLLVPGVEYFIRVSSENSIIFQKKSLGKLEFRNVTLLLTFAVMIFYRPQILNHLIQ